VGDCDHFFIGSRRRKICEGRSELSIDKANQFRAMWGLAPLAGGERVGAPIIRASSGVSVQVLPVSESGGGGCGGCGKKSATSRFRTQTAGPTKTTPSRIRQTKKAASFVSRAAQYAAAMARHIADDGAASSPETLAFRESCCESCPHNVDNVCSLCSCPLVKNLLNDGKLSWRSETCPVGKWFRQTDQQQQFIEPIRNLVFHVFPREGCEWNWHAHVQKIRENDSIWTGKRVISIGTGVGLASPETVQRQFDGIRVDHWVVMPNTPTVGETEPFIPALRLVESLDPNEMTMLAHTKGITHPQGSREGLWADMMWQVCLDLPSVDDALASHACAGPFKRHMRLLKSEWHYSGHFCWINNARIFSKPEWTSIVQQRAGMEAWLGAFVANKDAACLFHDDPPIGFLDESYWKNDVIPEFERWKEARSIQ